MTTRATFDAPAIPGLWYHGWPTYASVQRGGGPERVVTDEPDPDFVPRPVGFVPPGDFPCCAGGSGTFPYDEPIVEALPGAEPDLWEGDQA